MKQQDAALAVQQAIYTRLTENETLTPLISGFFSIAPHKTAYPYLSMSGYRCAPFNTKTKNGQSLTFEITCWDNSPSFEKAIACSKVVIAAITEEYLAISGFTTISQRYLGGESLLEKRQRLVKVNNRFEIIVQEI